MWTDSLSIRGWGNWKIKEWNCTLLPVTPDNEDATKTYFKTVKV